MMSILRDRIAATRDDGAIAVLVALLATVLFVMAAFAVDFGNAYSVKRQLSVAADASALAAAQAVDNLLPVGKGCYAPDLTAAATDAATTTNSQNDRSGNSTVTSVAVNCTTHGVEVTVTNARTVPTVFGRVIGVTSLNPSTTATALVSPPIVATGLRPIAACAATVVDATTSVPNKNFVVWISKDLAVCGSAASGAWGFANFLDQGTAYGLFNNASDPAYYPGETCASSGGGAASSGGNAGCQSSWILSGYGGPVYIPNTATSASTGLGGSSGLSNSSAYRDAMNSLVGQIIDLPVATAFLDVPGTDRLNTVGVTSVLVCSVNLGGTVTTGGPCTTNAPQLGEYGYDDWVAGIKNNEGALYVKPVKYSTTGVFGGANTGCRVGDTTCDFGKHTIVLYK
jgi:Flp pilus assembly protein TadG